MASFALVVLILRMGAGVLVPISIAALLAFLLSPLVVRLNRWGLGKTWAVAVTATFAFVIIGALGWVLTNQALDLVHELPNYERNIDAKIHRLRAPHTGPAFGRVEQMFDRLQHDMTAKPATGGTGSQAPVPVEVQTPGRTSWMVFRQIALPALEPFGTALIVVVFVVAILFQREDLRDRFLKVMTTSRLNMATQAVNDAADRISRYLGRQFLINAAYGCCIGLGLSVIGTPSPVLWGILATLLRFIPFIGAWIAAACPLVLALAIDPGWMKLAITFGLYAGMEFV
ncbi:MAG: AI-2E family transporter, partial [Opitutaceae bacterium]